VDNQEISYHCWGSNGGGGIIHIAGVTVQPGDSTIAHGPITLPQVPQSSHVVTDGLRMSMDELSPLPLQRMKSVTQFSPLNLGASTPQSGPSPGRWTSPQNKTTRVPVKLRKDTVFCASILQQNSREHGNEY
jgi:hypothetical protein